MRKKVVINAANLSVGGGLQVALSFISEMSKLNTDHLDIVLLCSEELSKLVSEKLTFGKVYVFKKGKFPTPVSLNIFYRHVEKAEMPSIWFSIFGPIYYRPKCMHLEGFANPWVIYPDSIAFSRLKIIKRVRSRIKYYLYKRCFLREGDHFVVEATHVKNQLNSVLKVNCRDVSIVPNTASSIYFDKEKWLYRVLPNFNDDTFKFITIAHPYSHKNLEEIVYLKEYLSSQGIAATFYVTMPDNIYRGMGLAFIDATENLGVLKPAECPSIYLQCDALFLPTLLECFSASYVEAMTLGLPIVCTDFSFNRDICEDAACYFEYRGDYQSIKRMILDPIYRESLVKKGLVISSRQINANQRAIEYLKLITENLNETNLTKHS